MVTHFYNLRSIPMPLDEDDTIPPLQSDTIKAAVAAIVINGLTLVTIFTGKVFDIATIKMYVELGVPLAVNALSVYLGWKAFKGRMNATQAIARKDKP